MRYPPIENHGIIGDLHTVALVGMDGSIDSMCFPYFDSPSVFAALLDDRKGGRFRIAPELEGASARQLYLPDTNVLLTRFLSDEGVAELSDFMPIYERGHVHDVVRRVKTVRGEVRYRMTCAPRFDYGRARHRIRLLEGGREAHFEPEHDGGAALRLRSTVPMEVHEGDAVATFTLAADRSASFVLEQLHAERESPSAGADYVADSFKDTVNFWRDWMRRCRYSGRWRETVRRSALTLKLLTSQPHGSLVAAPTFGLPELVGGERNWDYRYTWIRDASFTLYALIRLGYTEEAGAFMRWIEDRCRDLGEEGTLQIMYGIDGRKRLDEETLDHLDGYRGSRPVRIGNAAYGQLQLDIYGALLDSAYLYDKYGQPISYDLWHNLSRLVEWVVRHWNEPDEGVWEVRGGRRDFLYSRVMCWVAVDRAVRLAIKRSFPAPIKRWREARDAMYRQVFDEFWDPGLGAFVQFRGASVVDASSLLMPLVHFIGPTDPRWLSHLRCVEKALVVDSLVNRYRSEDSAPDGLEGNEGTFSMCTFWYTECLARSGDAPLGRFFFEKMLGYANHLGLYGEELGRRGEHLGNFPQAFTHLGLISAAYQLDRSLTESRSHGAAAEDLRRMV